jgi:hypothetical protein
MIVQILGYIATIGTILSFSFKEQKTLRLINSIACVLWIIYGIGINELPIILVNSIVLILNAVWFYDNKPKEKIMTQTEWNRERDRMANEMKHDPDFMYKWIRKNSGK